MFDPKFRVERVEGSSQAFDDSKKAAAFPPSSTSGVFLIMDLSFCLSDGGTIFLGNLGLSGALLRFHSLPRDPWPLSYSVYLFIYENDPQGPQNHTCVPKGDRWTRFVVASKVRAQMRNRWLHVCRAIVGRGPPRSLVQPLRTTFFPNMILGTICSRCLH